MAPLLTRIQERPWLIAVGLSLVVALWLASGQFGQAQTPPEAPAPALDESALMQVQVRQSQAQMLPLDREIRGRTEPWAAAELAAETEGRVVAVLREPGEMVEPGEIILKIDPRARAEVLEQARALSSQREAEFAAASRLHRQGHLTDTQLAQSRAALAGARAEEQRAQLDLDAATVRSPIAGRIEARPAQVGDYLKVGTVVARIATLDRLKLVSYVSELLVEELATAQKVQIDGRNGHPTQEGTVHFVARVGLDYVKQRILHDEANRKALWAELQFALDGEPDPWFAFEQARVDTRQFEAIAT
ncbi:MAG: efflux RND transporter periplasmic adaptor subunit [Oceanococcaceae bacterium]